MAWTTAPEAAAALAPGAAVVEAGESLEDPFAVGGGDARAIVVHDDAHGVVEARERDLHGRGGVAGGVVHQVADAVGKPVLQRGDRERFGAIVDDDGAPAVRVASADGPDRVVPVQTGLVADGWIEVTAGLGGGEDVRLPC